VHAATINVFRIDASFAQWLAIVEAGRDRTAELA
jgi:hypothetical protein